MALAQESTEQRDTDWLARLRTRLEDLDFPEFRWHAARFIPAVLLALLIAFLMPRFLDESQGQQRYANFFHDMSLMLDEMAKQDLITPEMAEEKKQEIEQLKAKAQEQGINQEIWLARDRIKSYIDHQQQKAAQRMAEAIVAAERLNQQQNLKQQQQLMQSLANLAKQNQNLLKKALNPENLQQMAAMINKAKQLQQLTPQQLQALQQQMQQQMQQQGLSPEQLAQMQQAQNNMSPEELKRFSQALKDKLCKQCQGMGMLGSKIDAMMMGMMPGRGDITRGPGHVQLTEKRSH